MENRKSIFASKSVWGSGTVILTSVLGLIGIVLTPADVVEFGQLVTSAVSLAGGVLAFYGRIKAKSRIA